MELDAINYLALNLKGNNQLGSKKTAESGQIDYTDGLSAEELKKIDKNGDGAITEAEFKKAFNGSKNEYKKYWDAYKSFYSASTKKKSDGTATSTATVNGKTVNSKYNKNGKLISYTVVTTAEDGTKTTKTYTVTDGVAKLKSTKVTGSDGSTVTTTTSSSGAKTKTTKDGTSVTKKDGKLTTISTKSKPKDTITFKYDSKTGKLKSATVKIGNQTYKGSKITTKKDKNDGVTQTIKDKKGNIVAKIYTDKNGKQVVTEYKAGKKYKEYDINKNGEATSIKTYATSGANKGKLIAKENCSTGEKREYHYKNGKLDYSEDFNSKGKRTSKQTYMTKTASDYYSNKKGHLWASRTFYGPDGKTVTGYQEYSYSSSKDKKSVTKTVTKYTFNAPTVLLICADTKEAWTIGMDGHNCGIDDAMIVSEPDDTYLTLYHPDDELLELVRTIAAGEGLYVWQP